VGAPLFEVGRFVVTPAAHDVAGGLVSRLLARHLSGDWGDVSESDKRSNDAAVREGGRLLSAYALVDGEPDGPGESNLDHFQRRIYGEHLVDAATVGGTFYGALKRPDDGLVQAVVILTKWVRGDAYNFGYKDMDESMGPCEAQCPPRILDLLSPVDALFPGSRCAEWAATWRAACRAHAAKRTKARAVKPGDRVRFAEPMKFTDGTARQTFRFVERNTFTDEDGRRCRVSKWRERSFEVLSPEVLT
jgi:hypothetical protein